MSVLVKISNLRNFFFELEAKDDVISPSEYPYMIMLSYTLTAINSWPHKETGYHESLTIGAICRYFNLFSSSFRIIAGSLFIIRHNDTLSFFDIGHIYLTLLMDMVIMSRIVTLTFIPKYRAVAKEFLTKTHLFYFKDDSEFAMKTHKQVHVLSHLFTLYLILQMISGLCMFNLIPMYNNYSSGKFKPGGVANTTFEHSLYYSYPFNTSTNINGYIVACILHWIFSYLCSTWFCMFDLFLSLMVFNVWGHFKILIHNLNNFPMPSLESREGEDVMINSGMYSSDELTHICKKLKDCIKYHRDIIIFTDKMSDVFGPMLFVYYMFHQTSGCILLLECSQMTAAALVRYLPLTIILFQQLIQLSIIFELVGSTSEKIKHAVYGLPWECMDTKNKKMVAFFLMSVQEPVHVKALGLANVGVTSMSTILKTSMSYFTFLRSSS